MTQRTPTENAGRAKPRVLVTVTGGTICMRPGWQSGTTFSDLSCAPLADFLTSLPELKDPSLPELVIEEWDELLDSSDATEVEWNKIAKYIETNYNDYDGFVILHGTDTLAYTASVLSFMFENLGKPVVLTGAMLPISHVHTDAKRNLTVSVMTAGWSNIPEVVVVFGTTILRGCRATKTDCGSFEAFTSPNYPVLGTFGVDVTVREELLLRCPGEPFHAFTEMKQLNIVVLQLLPGCQGLILDAISETSKRPLAVILELFGTGTAPMKNPSLQNAIERCLERGIILLAITQCTSGTCSLKTYSNGNKLVEMGVIEGKDMTVEAAFAKLHYLMGKGYTNEQIRTLAASNLRGEMTEYRTRITGQLPPMDPSASERMSPNMWEFTSPKADGASPHLESKRFSRGIDVRVLRHRRVSAGPGPTMVFINRTSRKTSEA